MDMMQIVLIVSLTLNVYFLYRLASLKAYMRAMKAVMGTAADNLQKIAEEAKKEANKTS